MIILKKFISRDMAIYHLGNQIIDANLGVDFKSAQVGHTIYVNTDCEYYAEKGEKKAFPKGKYKIIDIMHVVEYAAWLEPPRISRINVFLEELSS